MTKRLTVQRLFDECLLKGFPTGETEVVFTVFPTGDLIDGEHPSYELLNNTQLWSVDGNRDVEYVLLLREKDESDSVS